MASFSLFLVQINICFHFRTSPQIHTLPRRFSAPSNSTCISRTFFSCTTHHSPFSWLWCLTFPGVDGSRQTACSLNGAENVTADSPAFGVSFSVIMVWSPSSYLRIMFLCWHSHFTPRPPPPAASRSSLGLFPNVIPLRYIQSQECGVGFIMRRQVCGFVPKHENNVFNI